MFLHSPELLIQPAQVGLGLKSWPLILRRISQSSGHIAMFLHSPLSNAPCPGGGRLEEVASFPMPHLEELQTCPEKGPYIAGAALLGDALTGTALLLADSDGRPHCFWPALQPGRV
jgi:hypothetical protein